MAADSRVLVASLCESMPLRLAMGADFADRKEELLWHGTDKVLSIDPTSKRLKGANVLCLTYF